MSDKPKRFPANLAKSSTGKWMYTTNVYVQVGTVLGETNDSNDFAGLSIKRGSDRADFIHMVMINATDDTAHKYPKTAVIKITNGIMDVITNKQNAQEIAEEAAPTVTQEQPSAPPA